MEIFLLLFLKGKRLIWTNLVFNYLFINYFLIRYKTEFGFTIPDRKILIDDVRVRGIGKTEVPEDLILSPSQASPKAEKVR